jgi:hypothetical protein
MDVYMNMNMKQEYGNGHKHGPEHGHINEHERGYLYKNITGILLLSVKKHISKSLPHPTKEGEKVDTRTYTS